MGDMSLWWVRQGYPPFVPDSSGYPKAGQVLKYYREQTLRDDGNPWTQADLAHVLNVTTKAISEMENHEKGLDSLKRRRFLADLFAIPPILFGITSLDAILAQAPPAPEPIAIQTSKKLLLDTQEYTAFLSNAWSTYYSDSPLAFLTETESRLDSLYKALPFASGKEAEHLTILLSEYHISLASTLRDLRRYLEAIDHAHLAVLLAQGGENVERTADALYMRGLSRMVSADFPPLPNSASAATFSRNMLTAALADFEQASALESKLGLHQHGDIRLKVGAVRARLAGDYSAKKEALRLIDTVGAMARRSAGEEDPLYYKLNEDHFHLERSAVLVAVGWAKDAFDSLALVNSSSGDKRRVAYCDLLLAQTYLLQSDYPAALGAAESALPLIVELHSDTNIARLTRVYQQLKTSSFAKNPDLVRFGMQLSQYSSTSTR